MAGLDPDARLELDPSLYSADAGAIVERLRLVPDEVTSVMVVGHNPTLHELCFDLVSVDDEPSRRRLDQGFPTAALAVVGIEVPVWADLVVGEGHLEELVVPER